MMHRRTITMLCAVGVASGCAAAPTESSCDEFAARFRADYERDSTLSRDLHDPKTPADVKQGMAAMRDYAVSSARSGCLEEMTQAEVDCILSDGTNCFENHRPWYRKARYKVEDWME